MLQRSTRQQGTRQQGTKSASQLLTLLCWTTPRPPQRAQRAGTLRRRRGCPNTMRTVRFCPSSAATAGRPRRRILMVPSPSPGPGLPELALPALLPTLLPALLPAAVASLAASPPSLLLLPLLLLPLLLLPLLLLPLLLLGAISLPPDSLLLPLPALSAPLPLLLGGAAGIGAACSDGTCCRPAGARPSGVILPACPPMSAARARSQGCWAA